MEHLLHSVSCFHGYYLGPDRALTLTSHMTLSKEAPSGEVFVPHMKVEKTGPSLRQWLPFSNVPQNPAEDSLEYRSLGLALSGGGMGLGKCLSHTRQGMLVLLVYGSHLNGVALL